MWVRIVEWIGASKWSKKSGPGYRLTHKGRRHRERVNMAISPPDIPRSSQKAVPYLPGHPGDPSSIMPRIELGGCCREHTVFIEGFDIEIRAVVARISRLQAEAAPSKFGNVTISKSIWIWW